MDSTALALTIKSREDWKGWRRWYPRLLGLLASILLASLGSPFWFNHLKPLARLRPMISGKVEAERDTVPKK